MISLQNAGIVVGLAALLFKNHIAGAVNRTVDNLTELNCPELKLIRERCPRARHNVESEMAIALGSEVCSIVKEGMGGLEYELPYGRYWLDFGSDYLYVIHTEDSLTLRIVRGKMNLLKMTINFMTNWTIGWSCISGWWRDARKPLQICDVPSSSVKLLKDHVEDIHQNGASAHKLVWFFTANADKWTCPCARNAREFSHFTPEMREFLDDVEAFLRLEKAHLEANLPYRRGYMIHGQPGTNKSLCTEIVATRHRMSVYMLNIGDKNMTDSMLVNLVNRVPPRSIITIEEVDKQVLALKSGNSYVTLGGILTALDGPQRLPHGCIVIFTSNARNFLPENDEKALFRKGRIDKIFHFQTPLPSQELTK